VAKPPLPYNAKPVRSTTPIRRSEAI